MADDLSDSIIEGQSNCESDSEEKERRMKVVEGENFMDKLVINLDNPIKSKWDVLVLLFVAYSCITSMYNTAFTPPDNKIINIFDWVVEGVFYIDIILSFFQAYRDEDTMLIVMKFNHTYKHYIGTWFVIDILAVFPWALIFSQGVMLKLVRLARIPRLMKLLDVSRFKKVLQSFWGTNPNIF